LITNYTISAQLHVNSISNYSVISSGIQNQQFHVISTNSEYSNIISSISLDTTLIANIAIRVSH